MQRLILNSLLLASVLALFSRSATGGDLPGPTIPDGFGVNIHFCDPRAGEMEMLTQAGFRWIRTDLDWSSTERKKGVYDFSAHDRLMATLKKHRLRAVLVLDYSNPLYDNNLSPASDEGREAFARWAVAAVHHFRGQGVLWEVYNEPNLVRFWRPKPDVQQYAELVLKVGRELRKAEPKEVLIGPGTSMIDLAFLEGCFKAGVLEYFSGITVHPYRAKGPETVIAEYAKLRTLIKQYAPKGKEIPILAGEWGFSSVWRGMDDTKQGMMLPREWLVNLSEQIPLTIWYDWHDDGENPKEFEDHFGTVYYPYLENQTPVYRPKPAYLAAKTLTHQLRGFQFKERLAMESEKDYVLVFSKGDKTRIATWTTDTTPHSVVIPVKRGKYRPINHTGEAQASQTADAKGLSVTVSEAPVYYVPE